MPSTTELSLAQARKVALVSQGLHQPHRYGTGLGATLKTIEQLSYIQIDSISVVAPAYKRGIPVNTEFSLPIVIKTQGL